MTQKTITLLSYNIHKGFNTGNRRFILHQMREALMRIDCEVLCLQEAQGKHQQNEQTILDWPELAQFEFIADGGWPFYAYGKNAIYNDGHHGNAILSKYPFESWENINVSPFTWASRSLLHAVIRLPEHKMPVHIICIHFGLSGLERRQQMSSLCQRIDKHVPQDAALIIAGDFNDWLGLAERQFQEHLQLQEVFKVKHGKLARSFPAWLPCLPMDRIYYRGLTPISCQRLSLPPWHVLSDHLPLVATFAL